jgi:hypothetical protein
MLSRDVCCSLWLQLGYVIVSYRIASSSHAAFLLSCASHHSSSRVPSLVARPPCDVLKNPAFVSRFFKPPGRHAVDIVKMLQYLCHVNGLEVVRNVIIRPLHIFPLLLSCFVAPHFHVCGNHRGHDTLRVRCWCWPVFRKDITKKTWCDSDRCCHRAQTLHQYPCLPGFCPGADGVFIPMFLGFIVNNGESVTGRLEIMVWYRLGSVDPGRFSNKSRWRRASCSF